MWKKPTLFLSNSFENVEKLVWLKEYKHNLCLLLVQNKYLKIENVHWLKKTQKDKSFGKLCLPFRKLSWADDINV